MTQNEFIKKVVTILLGKGATEKEIEMYTKYAIHYNYEERKKRGLEK